MSLTKNSNDKYLFNTDDYKVVRCIKRGGFGVINLVRNKKSGEEFASKTNLIQTKAQNKLFVSREVRILIQIQHPTIIQFRGFSYKDFDNKKNITILMDYMKEGSLADLINKEMKSLCPDDYDNTKRQIILVGVARGMMILHNKHVIHRDLKPENILIDIYFHPHITDFGLSKFFDPHHSMNQSITNSGTAAYMAPEVINSDHFNSKADVYAFGILMYEVITGKRAYDNLLKGKKKLNEFQLKTKVTQGLRPIIEPKTMKKSIQNLIEKCWSQDPKERPSFSEIFKKLSLSRDDYFLEFEENAEPTILDEDDEEEDEDEEDFFISKRYCLDGVDYGEFLNYVDEIKEDPRSLGKEAEGKSEEVEKLREEVRGLKKKTEEQESEIADLKSEMKKKLKEQADRIESLEKEIEKKNGCMPISHNLSHLFYCEPSLTEPGILGRLKEQEKSPFDRLFVASQSSNDVYCLISSNSNSFGTDDSGQFYIEFELDESIMINGVKISSSNSCFPKSFDIKIDNQIVKSIKEANELNGKQLEMAIRFNPIKGQKIRFIQTGPNWDKENNFLYIKRFDVLSNEARYSKGVFSSFIEKSENNDPHKCPVKINAYHYDFNSFHELDTTQFIWTYNFSNSWFQVEFTYGLAVLSAARIKTNKSFKLKSFKIICTDDAKKDEEAWIKLIEVNEKSQNEHKILDIYQFPHQSPPTRFVRLVQTDKNWGDNLDLSFYHLDFFGCYF